MTTEYSYSDSNPTHANAYLWPVLQAVIAKSDFRERRAFDLGCGNGATSGMLTSLGFETTGVDPSESGIRLAKEGVPNARFRVGSAYDDLASQYGLFPLVVSLEVIEHCYEPRSFVKTFYRLLAPGGVGFISTPYHSYLKNLALAVSGKMDRHFTALWDGGHIKFFSIQTLREIVSEAGPSELEFLRVGRIPALAKSMVCVVRKPPAPATQTGVS